MGRKAAFPPPIYPRKNGMCFVRLRPAPGQVRDITLGLIGSAEAERAYRRIVAEMVAQEDQTPSRPAGAVLLISQLCRRHLEWADTRYEGRQVARIGTALEPLLELYGSFPVAEFGIKQLKTVRAQYVQKDYCRRLCNQMTDCVRWMFKRQAGELVTAEQAAALYQLPAIHKGEAVAGIVPPDHAKIEAVAADVVERTLVQLGQVVGDMVRLQRLTGARPGEVCVLRPVDVRRPWRTIDGVVLWLYVLDQHKTDWRGHARSIPLGPQAQTLLAPYLERADGSYCFAPAEARRLWEVAKRAARQTPVPPSQARRAAKKKPKKQPGPRYTTQSYDRAIAKAVQRAQVPPWAPNQLRHAVLEAIEAAHGQEDARCVAGHTTPTTTAIYTQGLLRAAAVMARMG